MFAGSVYRVTAIESLHTMASCTGSPPSPGPLEPNKIETLAQELHKCVKKDQLVKAKFLLKVILK